MIAHSRNFLYELHADVCKTLGNAKRLEIIDLLSKGEMSAGELIETLGLSKANVSQHLAVMKSKGVVISRKKGRQTFYKLMSPKIVKAFALMREVLLERMEAVASAEKKAIRRER